MLIVFNPAAGRRRMEVLWRVLDIMATSGIRVEVAETLRAGHATELARAAAAAGRPVVVAAGGDGTVAEVARGISGSGCRLGIIPVGTANVLAHELGLPFAPRDVAAVLAFGRSRTVWPGLARQACGPQTLFVQMLGAGFDAQVVHAMAPPLKRALGRGAYLVQGLREIARYRYGAIRLVVDGQEMQAGSVIVSKGQLYGGRYRLARGASPDARGFTVAVFEYCGPHAALLYGAALPLNLLPHMPGMQFLRASEITISSEHVPTQVDGEVLGVAPLTVTDSPDPIEILVR